MTDLLQFALLGLGAGAIYALAGQGIVQIYRGSGVLNFAHGAMALLSATLFVRLWDVYEWDLAPAMVCSIGLAAVVGALTHLLIMRPLRRASPLVRIIATIGLLTIIQQSVLLIFGSQLTFETFVSSFYPSGSLELGDGVMLGYDRVVLLGIVLAVTCGLWLLMRVTTFGLTAQAVAESRLSVRALGRSPDRIAVVSWAIGAALAGAAGVLIVPISGLANTALLLLVVPALAAALIGGFRSYWLTTLGALALGVGQSVLTKYSVEWDLPTGIPDALPFLVIIAVLTLSGSAIPRRDERPGLLPRVARRPPPLLLAAIVTGAAVAVAATASNSLAGTLATTALAATVALSLVVVTGLSGQISLGQYALAGIGGFAAGRLNDLYGWSFPVTFVIGVGAAILAGFVFALPALRTRGPALAVATIGLGLAVEKVIFGSRDLIGGLTTTPVDRPSLFGWEFSFVDHPQRYAVVAVVALAILAVGVANLRSGRVGRRMLAVRSNERAAAALGISVARVKLFAFGLGAGIAGVAGILMAFRYESVQYSQYNFFASLQIVTVSLIGGIGYVSGAVIGAAQVPNGLVAYLTDGVGESERWLLLSSAVLLLVILMVFPDGIAHFVTRVLDRVRAWRADRASRPVVPVTSEDAAPIAPVAPKTLEIDELVVTIGTTRVVDGISFAVAPGRITGLIGANGAGKTTLIDAVTGFQRVSDGRILLDGHDITRAPAAARASAGLGRCFQSVELFDDMTVREHLLVATERVSPGAWLGALVHSDRSELDPATAALARMLELDSVLDAYPRELPHGRRRLVGVARALAARPSVLLLDEPAAGLDRNETAELGDLVQRVTREWGVATLLVEHDVALVARVSDEVVAMDFGRPIFTGPPDRALADPAVRAAYLGTHEPDASEQREPVGSSR